MHPKSLKQAVLTLASFALLIAGLILASLLLPDTPAFAQGNGAIAKLFAVDTNGKWQPVRLDGANSLQVGPIQHWSITHTPAAAAQATASRSACGASCIHVADCVTATFVSTGTAPGATSQTVVQLRDGASGGGTVLASFEVTLPATANTAATPWQQCGLHIPGSANTIMTLEFGAAGATNTIESVTLSGYDR
jgi:hypothetical protein